MTGEPPKKYIVGVCADLMFSSRIESAANRLNYRVIWIERLAQLVEYAQELPGSLVENGAGLLDLLVNWQPALILIDMNIDSIPWREWTAKVKSSPATRRIPLLCFGAHMDVDAMKAAKDAGADAVLARSRFVADLPILIEKYARLPDTGAIAGACREQLSPLALEGLALFNQGDYFEAHERLEDAWNEDASPGRNLYIAILQVAVAYLQIKRRNYSGALKMFLRMRQWIDPLPDECRGVDVARLRQDAGAVHQNLLALGPEGIADFDTGIFRPVYYQTSL